MVGQGPFPVEKKSSVIGYRLLAVNIFPHQMIPHSCILGFIMFKSYAVVWSSKVAVTLLTWNVALHKRHVPCFEQSVRGFQFGGLFCQEVHCMVLESMLPMRMHSLFLIMRVFFVITDSKPKPPSLKTCILSAQV